METRVKTRKIEVFYQTHKVSIVSKTKGNKYQVLIWRWVDIKYLFRKFKAWFHLQTRTSWLILRKNLSRRNRRCLERQYPVLFSSSKIPTVKTEPSSRLCLSPNNQRSYRAKRKNQWSTKNSHMTIKIISIGKSLKSKKKKSTSLKKKYNSFKTTKTLLIPPLFRKSPIMNLKSH